MGRNLVVLHILCSHFTVKMTSWGFQGPTHTGHNWGHNPGVTLQSGCSLQSGVTLQSRATVQSRGTLQSVSLRGHIWITDIFNLGFFSIKYMQHWLFVFARRRIVTFQTLFFNLVFSTTIERNCQWHTHDIPETIKVQYFFFFFYLPNCVCLEKSHIRVSVSNILQ